MKKVYFILALDELGNAMKLQTILMKLCIKGLTIKNSHHMTV